MNKVRLLRLLRQFECLVRKHEFKGSYCPEDAEIIDREYKVARYRLYDALELEIPADELRKERAVPYTHAPNR